MTAGLAVQRLTSLAELEAAAAPWEAVHAACPARHVLLDHRWVCAWWRAFGGGRGLNCLLLRRDKEVVGVVPLILSRGWEVFPFRDPYVQIAEDYRHLPASRWRRWVWVRRLSFPLNIPSGNIRGHLLLAAGEDESEAAEALLRDCALIRRRWDLLALDGLPAAGGQEEAARQAAPGVGLHMAREAMERTMMRSPLPPTLDAFLQRRSGHFRKRLKQECNRLARDAEPFGGLHLRAYRGTEIGAGMDALFALEAGSWKVANTKRRRLHLRLDERTRRFHREVAHAFAATDQAQVLTLRIGERPVAALYSLERDGTTACVLTYMAADSPIKFSVAPLWRGFVEGAIGRGLREIDFNGRTRNVIKWAEEAVVYRRCLLFHGGPYSRFLRLLRQGAYTAHRFTTQRSAETASGEIGR